MVCIVYCDANLQVLQKSMCELCRRNTGLENHANTRQAFALARGPNACTDSAAIRNSHQLRKGHETKSSRAANTACSDQLYQNLEQLLTSISSGIPSPSIGLRSAQSASPFKMPTMWLTDTQSTFYDVYSRAERNFR